MAFAFIVKQYYNIVCKADNKNKIMVEHVQHNNKPDHNTQKSDNEILRLRTQIKRLETVSDVSIQIGATLELKPLLSNLVKQLSNLIECKNILVFTVDEEGAALEFGAAVAPLSVEKSVLDSSRFSVYNAGDDPVISRWTAGEAVQITEAQSNSKLETLYRLFNLRTAYAVPLNLKTKLVAVIFIETEADKLLKEEEQELLRLVAASIANTVENARLHSKMVEQLQTNMLEMNMLQQIDRELNDTIELNHVFGMALDWALRFSNAHAASLALYDEDEDILRIITHYGYEVSIEQLEQMRPNFKGGVTYRVARSGRIEIIPDVSIDQDYIPVAPNIRSQMSIPVMREDKVVAVITLESKKLNGFEEQHIEFVQKLATRAAVAIDNARLFNETAREREKLSHILSNIADIVIVIGIDEHIMLINQSAIAALRLYVDKNYIGQPYTEALENTALMDTYRRAKDAQDNLLEEVDLPNGRTFHTNIKHHEGIGTIIVLQDITPFKEMDKLKSELIATVSHDLKQPLSVMTGYLDLLEMKNKFDEQSSNFVNMIDRSIRNMRQLIDDLLDLAKIESGIELKLGPVDIKTVLLDGIDAIKPIADNKSMTIITEIPDNLSPVRGENARLRQIFDNLISNAVKYTPPEGVVRVSVEQRGITLRISVRDNGLGISPEDQAHIFDRFYRVRRPETDSIDGTGLGLAIVKTLVEAHHGKIGLESKLGEGSTFYVTLPTD